MGGEVRGPGPRSVEALGWVERLDAVGFEALACGLGFGGRAMYSHVARLARAGWVVRVYDRDGSLVAITSSGRRRARPELVSCRGARAGTVRTRAAHARAVSWVAAHATLKGQAWVGEREMALGSPWRFRTLSAMRASHRADLGVWVDGAGVAFEVELTVKAPARLRSILAGYEDQIHTGQLEALVYVVDDEEVARAVRRAARAVGLAAGSFRLVSLVAVVTETRALAGAASGSLGDRRIRTL